MLNSDIQVTPIPIYQDNYVWVIHNLHHCWIVDPGDERPVAHWLSQRGLTPRGILVTHKHWDHITGVAPLAERYQLPVYGPASLLARQITHSVTGGDRLQLFDTELQVISVPGHTVEHIAFYTSGKGMLFCGDTLFSAGCGRIFDGTVEALYRSLHAIKQLPPATVIYCTHEYTLANLKFARAVEPDNRETEHHMKHCQILRKQQQPTLPTRLALELAINPFLRTHEPGVRAAAEAHAGHRLPTEQAVFAALRAWKDSF